MYIPLQPSHCQLIISKVGGFGSVETAHKKKKTTTTITEKERARDTCPHK
jgi:hypothetical protein